MSHHPHQPPHLVDLTIPSPADDGIEDITPPIASHEAATMPSPQADSHCRPPPPRHTCATSAGSRPRPETMRTLAPYALHALTPTESGLRHGSTGHIAATTFTPAVPHTWLSSSLAPHAPLADTRGTIPRTSSSLANANITGYTISQPACQRWTHKADTGNPRQPLLTSTRNAAPASSSSTQAGPKRTQHGKNSQTARWHGHPSTTRPPTHGSPNGCASGALPRSGLTTHCSNTCPSNLTPRWPNTTPQLAKPYPLVGVQPPKCHMQPDALADTTRQCPANGQHTASTNQLDSPRAPRRATHRAPDPQLVLRPPAPGRHQPLAARGNRCMATNPQHRAGMASPGDAATNSSTYPMAIAAAHTHHTARHRHSLGPTPCGRGKQSPSRPTSRRLHPTQWHSRAPTMGSRALPTTRWVHPSNRPRSTPASVLGRTTGFCRGNFGTAMALPRTESRPCGAHPPSSQRSRRRGAAGITPANAPQQRK